MLDLLFSAEVEFEHEGVTLSADREVLAMRKRGPKGHPAIYRWTVYGPTGSYVTYTTTECPRFPAVEAELRAQISRLSPFWKGSK